MTGSSLSVFKDGWFVMDKMWDNSKLAEKFDSVYGIVEEIRSLMGARPLDMLDILLVADSENDPTYTLLQVKDVVGYILLL